MKLGRAGLVTAVCWSALLTVFASCSSEQASTGGTPDQTTGVPGAVGAGPTSGGTGGSSGDPRIDYCKDITKYCVEDADLAKHNQMYTTESNCRDMAMLIPEGQPGDSVGNSIQCRRHYLQTAMDNPDLSCRPAGPASFEGKCGQACEDFCVIAAKTCTGDDAQWPSENACKQACNKWSQLVPYYITEEGGPLGDNFACRLYHLTQNNCGAIGVDSEKCVDPEPRDAGMDVEQDAQDASDDAGDGGIMDSGALDADSGG